MLDPTAPGAAAALASRRHTAGATMAAQLHRLADQVDAIPGPLAELEVEVLFRVRAAGNATDAGRAHTVAAIAAATGTSGDLRYVQQISQFGLSRPSRYTGLSLDIHASIPPSGAPAAFAAMADVDEDATPAWTHVVGWFGRYFPGDWDTLTDAQAEEILKRCIRSGWWGDWRTIYTDVVNATAAAPAGRDEPADDVDAVLAARGRALQIVDIDDAGPADSDRAMTDMSVPRQGNDAAIARVGRSRPEVHPSVAAQRARAAFLRLRGQVRGE
jgi:hypothetical protein